MPSDIPAGSTAVAGEQAATGGPVTAREPAAATTRELRKLSVVIPARRHRAAQPPQRSSQSGCRWAWSAISSKMLGAVRWGCQPCRSVAVVWSSTTHGRS